MKSRITFRDQFESCYLRHQYLRRAKRIPTKDEMALYSHIVENFAKNTFFVYKNLFILVGLDLEDVINVAQVQLVSFLGLFSLECNPKKMSDFQKLRKEKFGKCTKNDILDKNKANFTCFLKQRMEDLVRVCRQKSKNIKGMLSEEYLVFRGKKRPPNDIEDLIDNHEEYGFKRIETSTFKLLKKNLKNNHNGPVYLVKNTWYVCVPLKKKSLTLTDFTCQDLDPYDNIHNMNPEDFIEFYQTEKTVENKTLEFNKSSKKEKSRIVKLFLEQNKTNPELKEEVQTAKKFLERLNGTAHI